MSEEKVSRRGYVKYAAAGVIVIAGAAAGAYYVTRPTGPPTPVGPTEITCWTISGPIWEIASHASGTYTEKNPNITVNVEQSDESTFEATYSSRFASAPPPDLAFHYPGSWFTYPLAEAGLLLELDEYYDKYGWEEFNPGYKNYIYNGNAHIIVQDYVGYPFIYYNPEIFEELGVSVPKTIQELYDICDKARDAGYLSCTWGLATAPGWSSNLFSFIIANTLEPSKYTEFLDAYGMNLETPEFQDRTVKWTDPEFVNAFKLIKEFGDNIYNLGYVGQSDDDAIALFANGKSAMYQSGSWGPAILDPAVKDFDYKVFGYPLDWGTVTPKKIASVDNSFAVSSKTKQPDICADFLDHLVSMEEQIWCVNNQGIFPARNDVDPAKISNKHLADNYVIFLEHEARMVIQLLVHTKIAPEMISTVSSVLEGTVTPEDAAKIVEDTAVRASAS